MLKKREKSSTDKVLERKGRYKKLVLTREGELIFEENGNTLKLKEVNVNGQKFKAPYSIDDAKKIATAKKTFLSILPSKK